MRVDPYSSNISERWTERIVRNNWHKLGKVGAKRYLEQYGKNIGKDKLNALKQRAEDENCKELAEGFQEEMDRMFGTISKPSALIPAISPTPAKIEDPYKSLFNALWDKKDYRTFETKQDIIKILENSGRFNDLGLALKGRSLLPTQDCALNNVKTFASKDFKWIEKEKKWTVEHNGYEYIIRQS